MQKQELRTQKEVWLKALMARIGLRKAAVALANKILDRQVTVKA